MQILLSLSELKGEEIVIGPRPGRQVVGEKTAAQVLTQVGVYIDKPGDHHSPGSVNDLVRRYLALIPAGNLVSEANILDETLLDEHRAVLDDPALIVNGNQTLRVPNPEHYDSSHTRKER